MNIPFTGLKRQYSNLRQEILDATDAVLTSGKLMNGYYTKAFEVWLAEKNNTNHAVLCHSGTQALEILANYYRTHGNQPEPPTVLVPSMTFPASANAFVRAGWNIHLVDTDAYGIIDMRTIPADLSYQAILGVGLYGAALPNSLRRLAPIIIEDAAQHWLSDDCHRAGESTAVSFDPMKNLNNYGNGGAIITNYYDVVEYARNWTDNGKASNHSEIGSNSRMSEVDCAQMMVKAKYLDRWQARRKEIAMQYIHAFRDTALRCLIDDTNIATHCFHKFVVDVDHRDVVQSKLEQRGIETKVHYQHPLHELGAYQQYDGPSILSAASSLSRRCLSLPIYPELEDAEVEYVVSSVLDCV
jgi:dTDP-4-amino-4,6-dideoxygalactose transaminase